MRPSRKVSGYLMRVFAAFLFLAAMTPSLMAQKKNSGGGSPPPPHPSGGGGGAPHPNNTGGGAHPNSNTGTHTNTNSTSGHTNTGTNSGTRTNTNSTSGHTNTGTNTTAGKTGTGTTAGKTGYGTNTTAGKTGTGAGAGKAGNTSLKANAVANGANKANATGTGSKGMNTPGTTKLSNGGTRTVHTNGSVVEKGSNGKLSSVTTAKGTTAKMNSNGKVASVSNTKGLTVNHAPTGNSRTVVSHGANGNKVVSTGKGRGYSQHTYSRNGHSYARRTYYRNGRYYARAYRGYYWHGRPYYGYVPGYYWGPAYYGWAYNPWAAPVYYNWGWGAAPWYGPYGYYFSPYPYYSAPYFWLTDYMVAATLAAAYEASASNVNMHPEFVAAAYRVPDDTKSKDVVLTPEIKKMLADEVKAQIGKDKADAATAQGGSGGAQNGGGDDQTPPSLDPDFTIFIVNADLTVDVNGQSCSLTAGDFIHREVDAPGSDDAVAVKVVASKKEDCPVGSDTRVQLEDLTDMYNHFREQLDAGMKDLSEKQGKNGIPKSPEPGMKSNPDGQAAPDLTTQGEIDKAQADADAAESDVKSTAAEDNKS